MSADHARAAQAPRVGVAQAGIVWITGFNLRSVIIALPPVLPVVSSDLGLSVVAVGGLTSMVLLCLGLGAIPGAYLTNRLGANRVVQFAIVILAVAAAGRLLPPQTFWLFAGSALLTLAVAVAQPAVSYVIRSWFPDQIPRISSLYVSGLTLGGIGGASLTPLLAARVGWRATFVVWGLVAGAGALLWIVLARGRSSQGAGTPVSWTVLRTPGIWLAAGALGAQNMAYFTTATWVTFLLRGFDATYVAGSLLLLNGVALPLALFLASIRWHYETSALYYVAAGVLTCIGAVGLLAGQVQAAWLLCLVLGLGTGMAFIGAFAIPPVLARRDEDVPAYSAVVFTVGYSGSFLGPWLGGVLVARQGSITASFWPVLAGGVLLAAVGLAIRAFAITHHRPEAADLMVRS